MLTDGIALSWACAVHVSQAEQLASEHWPLFAEEFGCAVGWEQMPQLLAVVDESGGIWANVSISSVPRAWRKQSEHRL